ncbi:MAG: sulfite exporter TauE/SafE family protein [Dehalococcoidia bacterium]
MTTPYTLWGLPTWAAPWELPLLGVISFLVGILGGFVGLALGTMRLTVLLLLGFPAGVAGGSNILVSTAGALTGAWVHLRERRVVWRVVATMGGASVVGAFLGALGSGRVPEGVLVGGAGMLVLWQGVELVVMARRGRLAMAPIKGPAPSWGVRLREEVGVGLLIGLVGGAVGLILGTLRLPAMLRRLKMDPRQAAGTNLAVGLFLGLSGFFGHLLRGEQDWAVLVVMVPTGMLGTFLGARLTGRTRLTVLVGSMGVVLMVVGALLVWDGWRRGL